MFARPMCRRESLLQIVDFLRHVGLVVDLQSGASGFVEGVLIREGGLLVDLDICDPSSLLHEAGHLAIVPGQYRPWMNDNLVSGIVRMFDHLDANGVDPCSPLYRAAMQCSDPEATAWAWAAGLALGHSPEAIILPAEYDGNGVDIRTMLRAGRYLGINGLACAGFCTTSVSYAKICGLPAFPGMKMWLQPSDLAYQS